MAALYIFLDESGNLDFSPKGSKYYVLAAVKALQPLASSQELQQLKYDLLREDVDIEGFHASEDSQLVRDKVFDKLQQMDNHIQIDYIYAEKAKTHSTYRSAAAFYALLGKTLLKYLLNGYDINSFDKIVIIFDKMLRGKDQDAFLKVVKPELKSIGKPYSIYFHRTLSDFNGQIAHYAAWSEYVSLERNEQRPLDALVKVNRSQFDVFRSGKTRCY